MHRVRGDFDPPVRRLKRAVAAEEIQGCSLAEGAGLKAINPRILLLPGLDCGIHLPGQGRRYMTVDEYAGWGDKMYGEGAKGIYFFNLFCEPYERHPAKTETWELVTKEGFTPENLAKRKRTVPKNAPRECARGGWCSPTD